MEKPYEGKAKINITAGFCEIVMPSKKAPLTVFFVVMSLIVMLIVIPTITITVTSGNMETNFAPFLGLWLVGMGLSMLFLIRKGMWLFFGKEIITIERNELTITRNNLWFYK